MPAPGQGSSSTGSGDKATGETQKVLRDTLGELKKAKIKATSDGVKSEIDAQIFQVRDAIDSLGSSDAGFFEKAADTAGKVTRLPGVNQALNLLNAPVAAAGTVIDATLGRITGGNIESKDGVDRSATDALGLTDKGSQAIGLGAALGNIAENVGISNTLKDINPLDVATFGATKLLKEAAGVKEGSKLDSVLGFGASLDTQLKVGPDILFDPTNYVGVGLVDDAGKLARVGSKLELAEHVARTVADPVKANEIATIILQRGRRALNAEQRAEIGLVKTFGGKEVKSFDALVDAKAGVLADAYKVSPVRLLKETNVYQSLQGDRMLTIMRGLGNGESAVDLLAVIPTSGVASKLAVGRLNEIHDLPVWGDKNVVNDPGVITRLPAELRNSFEGNTRLPDQVVADVAELVTATKAFNENNLVGLADELAGKTIDFNGEAVEASLFGRIIEATSQYQGSQSGDPIDYLTRISLNGDKTDIVSLFLDPLRLSKEMAVQEIMAEAMQAVAGGITSTSELSNAARLLAEDEAMDRIASVLGVQGSDVDDVTGVMARLTGTTQRLGVLQDQAEAARLRLDVLADRAAPLEALSQKASDRGLEGVLTSVVGRSGIRVPEAVSKLRQGLRTNRLSSAAGAVVDSKSTLETSAVFVAHASYLDNVAFSMTETAQRMDDVGISFINVQSDQIPDMFREFMNSAIDGVDTFDAKSFMKQMFSPNRAVPSTGGNALERLDGLEQVLRQQAVVDGIAMVRKVSRQMEIASESLIDASVRAEAYELTGGYNTVVGLSERTAREGVAQEDLITASEASINAIIDTEISVDALHEMLQPGPIGLAADRSKKISDLVSYFNDPTKTDITFEQLEGFVNKQIKGIQADVANLIRNVEATGVNPDALSYLNANIGPKMIPSGNLLIEPGSLAAKIFEGTLKPWNETNIREFERTLGAATDVWKAMAVSTPAFNFRNYLSGLMNNAKDGMRAESFASWNRNERYARAAYVAELRGNAETAKSLWDRIPKEQVGAFRKVMSTGITGTEGGRLADAVDAITNKKLAGFIDKKLSSKFERLVERGVSAPSRKLAGGKPLGKMHPSEGLDDIFLPEAGIEYHNRGMLMFQEIMDGGTTTSAVLRANAVHFDYRDLSPMEKHLRATVFPFLTWKLRNTPLQLSFIGRNPGAFKLETRLYQQSEENNALPLNPAWNVTGVVHLPFRSNDGALAFGGGISPTMDLYELAAKGPVKVLVESSSPLLRIPYTLITGQDPETGRAIPDKKVKASFANIGGLRSVLGPILEAVGVGEVVNGNLYVERKWDNALMEGVPLLAQMDRMFTARQGSDPRKDRNLIVNWLNYWVGLRIVETTGQDQAGTAKSRDWASKDLRKLLEEQGMILKKK